jgi:hypothetical protein
VSVGPEFAGSGSLDDTPLRTVLPAHPIHADSGDVVADDSETDTTAGAGAAVIGPFRPAITAAGARHPVTANLPGWHPEGPPSWGHWYRRIPATEVSGQVLMSAPDAANPDGAPLLLLDHVGSGRVALLLSDQIWLWARGHDGGGPQAELMRRIAHWLMKQPDLEENALEARIEPLTAGGGRLVVTRRSMTPGNPTITVTDPTGARRSLTLTSDPNSGSSTGSLDGSLAGVWQVTDGEHTAYAAASAANPREIEDLRATAEKLGPLAAESGGGVHWLAAPDARAGAPELRRVSAGRIASGRDWIGIPSRDAHVTTSITTLPLLPAWLALMLLLGAVGFAWWRESA